MHRSRPLTVPVLLATLTGATLPGTAAAAMPQNRGHTSQVRFVNRTPHYRKQIGFATVPFPDGVWTSGKSFRARGHPSELVPFGARWPDGSVRFAQLAVVMDLRPGEEELITIEPGPPPPRSFRVSRWVDIGAAMFSWSLVVGLPGGGTRSVGLRLVEVVERSPLRRVYHFRDRVPDTHLVYDLWLTLLADQDHAPFELRVTSSSTESKVWSESFEYVDLWTSGAMPMVRGYRRRGVSYGAVSPGGPSRARLLPKVELWDGQGAEWWGDMIFFHPDGTLKDRAERESTLLATVRQPLWGCATNWRESGAFGPFGHVPPDPPWISDGGRKVTDADYDRFRRWVRSHGKVFDDLPLGLLPIPSFTGDQPDFGAAKLVNVVASGLPALIEEARFNVSEEAYRPVHHREADGSPVRTRNHPDWVTWGGRTHFSKVISPDRLGKPFPEPYLDANGWAGRDNEHWSSLTLASTYLLTRSRSLRHELDNEAELYMAGHTLASKKPNWSTNALGQSRATGRTLLSMSWNYLCTGRRDLRGWIAEWAMQTVARQAIGMHVRGPVRPLIISGPDFRTLHAHDHWRPWEEAQAVLGLEACHRVTGNATARLVAMMTAKNLVSHGWQISLDDAVIATAVGWKKDGMPLTPAEYKDPEWVLWSFGTAFSEWALPSVILAHRYANQIGDRDMKYRALLIWADLQRGRRPPRDGGWDRYADWAAVE